MGAFAGVGLNYTYTGMVVADSILFDRGHMIRRWADGVARNFQLYVREEAPINKRPNTGHGAPGALKAGLFAGVERVGPKHLVVTVTSAAPYTKFVAGGTRDIIVPKSGRAMRLPLNPGFAGPRGAAGRNEGIGSTMHRRVRGQERNMFFERAFVRTARRHPSLRPGAARAFSLSV